MRRLQARLAEDRAQLLSFDQCSSDEFVRLTECLATLDAQLATVGQEAAQLNAALQDNDEDRAHQSAFELYKKSVDLAHASIGIALSQEEEMEQLEGSLLQHRNHFARNSLMFRLLVLSVRAESARIDAEHRTVFASVADDMAAMEQKMGAAVNAAFQELETIVGEAVSGRSELLDMQTKLHARAQQSVQLLRSELDGLKRSLAPCADANRQITELLARARDETAGIITALQFQDIVRQQLEHVGQGFADLAAHVGAPGTRRPIDFAFLRQAAQLQQTHLRAARQAIEQAAGKIGDGGQALLATGGTLVARFEQMERIATDVFRGSRLDALFHEETNRLVAVAGQSEATNERIARLLDRIESSVRVFSTEISHYEFEVQLIALNSQVAAARVAGAPALNKLAEETAHLSLDTAALTRAMTTQLGATLARLQGMRREADGVRQTIGREKAELAAGVTEVTAKLARLNQRIHRTSTELSRRFLQAYHAAGERLRSLRFPSLIDSCFTPAQEACTRLLEATALAPDRAPGVAAELATHAARYTMQQERDAHAAALRAGPSAAPAEEFFDDEPAAAANGARPGLPEAAVPAASPGVELF